jgi:transposase
MDGFSDFIGIDVSKDKVDLFYLNDLRHVVVKNREESLIAELSKFKNKENTLVILENTGAYEKKCIEVLLDSGFKVHRTDNLKFKNFKKQIGGKAKTDKSDSRKLALYGKKNYDELSLYVPTDTKSEKIKQLSDYLDSLKAMRAKEKTRIQSPGCMWVEDEIKKTIGHLDGLIKEVEEKLKESVKNEEKISKDVAVLDEYSGIGEMTAIKLALFVPELGKLNRRKISALCGVAPIDNQSGEKIGYKTVKGGGRPWIRKMLFMCAAAAVRHNDEIKKFYEGLISRGKKKMVALIACIRKIVVQLNAIMKRGFAIR